MQKSKCYIKRYAQKYMNEVKCVFGEKFIHLIKRSSQSMFY